MNRWTLLWRNLIFFRRTHFGVVLGVIIGTAVLTGALLVGDSVDATLRANALNRLGNIHYALYHPTRFVTEELVKKMDDQTEEQVSPGLFLQGMISLPASNTRANQVSVYGITDTFWQFSSTKKEHPSFDTDSIVLNKRLAEHLGVNTGDALIVRMQKPSALSYDAPLSTDADSVISLRLNVSSIIDDEQMGRFDLRINQVPPMNAYLPLAYLQKETELTGKINMILADQHATPDEQDSIQTLERIIKENWTLEDSQLEFISLHTSGIAEIKTDRIFLDSFVVDAVKNAVRDNTASENDTFIEGITTYLGNEIRIGDHAVPYSMVSALDEISPADDDGNRTLPLQLRAVKDLKENEIILNQWTADDLNAKVGDTVTIQYYVMGQIRQLEERAREFIVHSIVPMDHPLCDPTLMPNFPGIAESENSRDWDPGFSIDLGKIRDKDEDYWDEYKGTPKAFVNLNAGVEMWGSRYGNYTAIRMFDAEGTDRLREQFTEQLNPLQVGMVFQPLRQQALDGVNQAIQFAPLFGGFSFFLIAAALILVGLLFVFGIEQRTEETGTLLALGFTAKSIQSLYLYEGLILSCTGSVIGVGAGLLYTQSMLWGLETIWSSAVNDTQFIFAVSLPTMVYGFFGGVVMSVFAVWLTLRKHVRSRLQELLSGSIQVQSTTKPARIWNWITTISLAACIVITLFVPSGSSAAQAGKFFGSGALLLIAAIGLVHRIFHIPGKAELQASFSTRLLCWRNLIRRSGRSMAVVSLLACGSFLVIAVGANRKDAAINAGQHSSGTGGYTFWGEMTVPVLHNLNTENGLNEYGLTKDDVPETTFMPVRIRQGDDASCLNLSRAQNPRLFAVDPNQFAERGAFTVVDSLKGEPGSATWLNLNEDLKDHQVPAVIDQATMLWALGRSLGDSLQYTNEKGEDLEIVLVGTIANSIFQGGIIIAENHFVEHFPSSSGYSLLLVDTPMEQEDIVAENLSFALQDYGLNIVPAAERLAAFLAVENTYLSIFQILGGLGLILGSAGIGIVMLRNVLERRGELALMRAVGFTTHSLRQMLIREHGILFMFGLLCGILAGAAAVAPALLSRGNEVPYTSLTITLIIMLFSGWLWIWIASQFALKGEILGSLRNE